MKTNRKIRAFEKLHEVFKHLEGLQNQLLPLGKGRGLLAPGGEGGGWSLIHWWGQGGLEAGEAS